MVKARVVLVAGIQKVKIILGINFEWSMFPFKTSNIPFINQKTVFVLNPVHLVWSCSSNLTPWSDSQIIMEVCSAIVLWGDWWWMIATNQLNKSNYWSQKGIFILFLWPAFGHSHQEYLFQSIIINHHLLHNCWAHFSDILIVTARCQITTTAMMGILQGLRVALNFTFLSSG